MIYFIQDDSSFAIKIGYTAGSAETRLGQLQTGNPSGLVLLLEMEGSQKDEAHFHWFFASLRERGEWFRPGPKLMAFIIKMASALASELAYEKGRREQTELLQFVVAQSLKTYAKPAIPELLAHAKAAGLKVVAEDGKLIVRGPKSSDPELVRQLLARKAELMPLVVSLAPKPGETQFDAGMAQRWCDRWLPSRTNLTTHSEDNDR